MKNIRMLLVTMVLCSLTLGVCNAFTFGGDFNYQTSSGGIVHFGRDITVGLWDQVGTLTRFSAVIWNGNNRGVLMVDAPTGTTVNFTSLQQTVLIYNVTDVGVGTQSINYQGLGRPSSVDGGTFVMDGDTVVVTTNGDVIVTILWRPALLNQANQILQMLGVFMMVPIMLGALGVRGVLEGSIDQDDFTKLVYGVVTVVIVIFTIGLLVKSMAGA